MEELALRCSGCGAALRVPQEVESATCASCGAGVRIHREGGAVYTTLDRELEADAAPSVAVCEPGELPWPARPPGRASAIAAGVVAAGAGISWAALSLSAGTWGWFAAGTFVGLTGAASALRAALARRS